MRLLVTGCRGFIGSSVGRSASAAGHTVLGVGRSSQAGPDWAGGYVQADVLHADLGDVVRDFAPDVVFHGAGTASVGGSLAAPLDDLRAAVMTWANTLESIRRSGVGPAVLFPSSAAVYGNPTSLPIREDAPVAPVSPYGFHKAACELIAREYAECFGLHIVLCRIFSVFGPTQRRLLVWELFRQCVGPGQEVSIKGTGHETRDYLSIDDVDTAFLSLAALPRQSDGEGRCETVNLASGQETPILTIAERMRDLIAPAKQIVCQGVPRPGDPTRWQADVRNLHRLVPGLYPRPLATTIADCVALWQNEAMGLT